MSAREIVEEHRTAPRAPAFMARALLPSRGLSEGGELPRIVERWSGLRFEPAALAVLRRATGHSGGDGIGVLEPHVLGFRLQMALLTHRAYPLPIWNALQVRNRLVRHRRIDEHERYELETRTGAQRVVRKGVEIDLHSRLTRGSECYWESEIAYFYRGRFGAPTASPPAPPALDGAAETVRLRIPRGGGWRIGRLTGDYNGIHLWSWYARRFGFPAAFLHPQRVAGMCLARLPRLRAQAQTLELWIRGPVFYGAEATLKSAGGGTRFGLSLEGDERFALLGRRWPAGAIPA